MNLLDVLAGGGGVLFAALTLVQVAPIEIKPWSWLAKTIGKALNSEMEQRLDGIEKKLDGHIMMDDERMADTHRTKILHFNNELLRDIDHTKEEFVEILTDIDEYEAYCKSHEDYKNNRAVHAVANIKRTYDERLDKHDFLQ